MPRRIYKVITTLVLVLVVPACTLAAQQTVSAVLAQAQTAMITGSTPFRDITLTGTVEYISGTLDKTGTITMYGLLDGSSRFDVTLPDRAFSESVFHDGGKMHGQKKNAAGEVRDIAAHNVMTDGGWFCPAFLVLRYGTAATLGYVSGGTAATYNGQPAVLLTSAVQPNTGHAPFDAAFQALSQTNLYLDPNLFVPVAYTHQTHPANNFRVNIPMEARYSQYQIVDGVNVPMHIQRYMNGALDMDIQLTAAQINTGLTASTFHLQ